MLAYHSDAAIKTAILAQLQGHHDADEFKKGCYWEGGKGCAVGCTIYSGNHVEYERRFGIPHILARLEDRLFEELPNAAAKQWPLRFMGAIRPGSDLSQVWKSFVVWLLMDTEFGVLRRAATVEQRAIIIEIAALYERGERDEKVWRDVQRRAWQIRTKSLAAYAAYAAAVAGDALTRAASATGDALTRAASAAGDALTRAASGRAASQAAASAARERHIAVQADKLIALLEAAPLKEAA